MRSENIPPSTSYLEPEDLSLLLETIPKKNSPIHVATSFEQALNILDGLKSAL